MRFHTAVTTLVAVGALAAVPQLAAAGCFTATDIKIAHAEAVGTGGPPPTATEITLDGACYNLAAKVYLGQANGSLPLVPAGQITNNGSNQIILAIPEVLAPGDYLIELRTAANALGSSVLVTVPDTTAGGGATGYERVAGTTSADDENQKTATATCPEGKKVVGGGWALSNQSGLPPAILASQATSDTVWSVTTSSTNVLGDNSYSLTAYAVCIVAEADAP